MKVIKAKAKRVGDQSQLSKLTINTSVHLTKEEGEDFAKVCTAEDRTKSQVLRRLIRGKIARMKEQGLI